MSLLRVQIKGMYGNLYIVATPIGNLEDISLRALRILKEADFIFAEDTRVTKTLLKHYNINTFLEAYHQHSSEKATFHIAQLLREGKNCALVTDAGTPGISDPGNELVARLYGILGMELRVVPIPGPSALTALASVSGLPMQNFVFLGYPPTKKGRKTFFNNLAVFKDMPKIIYESPYRVAKTLMEARAVLGDNAKVIVGRELTKKFETIFRGTLEQAIENINKEKPRGEYTIIFY